MRAGGGGRGRRGPAEGEACGGGPQWGGRDGEREGRRDSLSVTLPKGVCAVRTCKRVSCLPPRARGGGVLGEERGWGRWGSNEPWRRGEISEEGVVVHVYLSMYKSLQGGGGELCCWEGECTSTCVCNECGRARARARRHVRARAGKKCACARVLPQMLAQSWR